MQEMPRYSFRLTKDDVELQARIEQAVSDSKVRHSEVIRELMHKGFQAEKSAFASPNQSQALPKELTELKNLVLQLVSQQGEMLQKQNELTQEIQRLKTVGIITQPIETKPLSEENLTSETPSDTLVVTKEEEEMGNIAEGLFGGW